nr:PREDICTED: uncharacterized protein LOC107076158 isoform X1 [Lepisosteus oculatus]
MSLDSSLLIDGVLTWDSGICRCSQSSTPDQHVEKHQFICVNALSVSSRQAAEEPRGFSILACGPAVTTTQLLQEDLGASGRGRVEEAVGRPGSSGTGGQGMGMLGNGTRQPGLERAPPDLQLEDKGLCLTGGDGTPSAPQGTRRQAGCPDADSEKTVSRKSRGWQWEDGYRRGVVIEEVQTLAMERPEWMRSLVGGCPDADSGKPSMEL